MFTPDASLPIDDRLYAFRNYQSVFPMPDWGTLPQWKKERLLIREHLRLCAGLNDRTEAFRARGRIIRRFRHEGIVIENIRIESLPGLFVMGNLYRPESHRASLSLVLHPHGHGMHSRTRPLGHGSAPHRAMNHALNGFAAFAWSMIGLEDDALQLEHRALLKGEHKRACNLLGLSAFGLQLNNTVKVLDYLLSRDDIDARRVGCTGESGGATQTYFAAALDDRIHVAAPAVMLSGHYQGGCVCENAPNLHLKYGTVHYAALIAPRPLFLTGCTGDWTHHMRERELPALRRLYALYGKEDAVDGFFQDERHNYNKASRERVYAWMARWLTNDRTAGRRIPESRKPIPAPEQLLVHDTPVPPVPNAITSTRALVAMWRGFHDRPDTLGALGALDLSLPDAADLLVRNMTPRYSWTSKTLAENRIDYGRFSESSGLTCRFVLPERGERCLILLRDWKDEEAWRRFVSRPPAFVQTLLAKGNGVIVPLLYGQRAPAEVLAFRSGLDDSYLASSYNRTAHLHQVGDILSTFALATIEMRLPAACLSIAAGRDIALRAYVAWSFLCSRAKTGPFAGDFRGHRLGDPSTWARYAYLPLVLRGGGIEDLGRSCRGRRALCTGVAAVDRKRFPRGTRVESASRDLGQLAAGALRLRA